MFFNTKPLALFVALLSVHSINAYANESQLLPAQNDQTTISLSPNKCVTLRKGRECFATIQINWKSNISGHYCIHRHVDNLMITCWKEKKEGQFLYIFQSSQSEEIELVFQKTKEIVSSARITINWVYKSKKRKRRWRIF